MLHTVTSPSRPASRQRRRFLQAAVLGPLAGMALTRAAAAETSADPAGGIDVSAASPELTAFMTAFFTAKTARDVGATMAFFSPALVTYIDAVLGWDLAGYDAVEAIFADYMPKWPATARSYPTRIVGDMQGGAFIAFTDTPELFGGELRILAALDFKDGKIIRWIDHWDSRGWPNAYGIAKSPLADYREAAVPAAADARLADTATRLFAMLGTGAVDEANGLLADDVVLEDMALRAQLIGRTAVQAYLSRALPGLPYGPGVTVRHVTGSASGGAIEWTPSAGAPVRTGVTGVVLGTDGAITRLTTVYDGALYDKAQVAAMAASVLDI